MINAPPSAGAMLQSLRGVGYSTWAAIADIIDNSISAGARSVRLDFVWANDRSAIRILDDGSGMDGEELSRAMRLGSINPLQPRESSDLGRFGMGLKTASLSQCRRLTVSSSKSGKIQHRRWDLDFIAESGGGEWLLLTEPHADSEPLLGVLNVSGRGTVVLWEACDRIVTAGYSDRDFLQLIDRVQSHLAMVFHRYLDGPRPRLQIYINGETDRHRVRAWDPFLEHLPATTTSPLERLSCGGGIIEVQGHVLPHHDRLTREQNQAAAGPEGWVAQQGFYVYRNERLLVAGSWLGLGPGRAWTKEEPYKLARIRVDFPNSLDEAWKIDIRKSLARPPVSLRSRLTQLADKVRSDARRVFAHRGQYGRAAATADLIQAWKVQESSRGVRYLIDNDHPAVRAVLDQAGELTPRVRTMLRVIEESVPIQRIWLDTVERGDVPSAVGEDTMPLELMDTLREIYFDLVRRIGLVPEVAMQQLLRTAPFNRWPAAVLGLAALSTGTPDDA